MIIKTLSLGNMDNNCYIIADETSRMAAIIDAPTDAQQILQLLQQENFQCAYILLTHSHYDHIGAVDELKSTTGAKIAIHSSEAAGLNNPGLNLSILSEAVCPVTPTDILLSDGDIIEFGKTAIRATHTPGHTVGSMCFYAQQANALFSGDTLFFKDVGRCDLPGGSYEAIKQSIRKNLYVLPDKTVVYPGHGRSSSIAYEKVYNNYVTHHIKA